MEQDVEQIHFWFVDFATDPVCSHFNFARVRRQLQQHRNHRRHSETIKRTTNNKTT